MGEDKENFRYKLEDLAKISDYIENSDLFKNEEVVVKVNLDKSKYDNILKNFREIDWSSEKFYINIGTTSFKFVLKK
jgi:acetolactate synthase small subunit